MTADRDAARDQLAAALLTSLQDGNPLYYEDAADELADALLPVVDRIANERAAAELRSAADAAHDEYSGWEAAAVVRARADALDPS